MTGYMFLYLCFSYLLGNIMTGYFVVKALGNKDIREQGSGSVGARNAGRVHGKQAFILTFLGDALKGVLVILLARFLHFSNELELIGLALAILGHIKPIMLRFKGGKGISTFIGGMIIFEPIMIPVIIMSFLLLYILLKSFTFAGLTAFLLFPITLFYLDYSVLSCLLAIGMIAMLYLAHTENIMERLKKIERKS